MRRSSPGATSPMWRAAARDERRVAEFVVEVGAVELPRTDQVDEAFGKIEADANAGGGGAALVAERERRTHRHSRFQLAVGRNDERSEPLRQRRCTRCENFRKRAHEALGFRRPREAPLTRLFSRYLWTGRNVVRCSLSTKTESPPPSLVWDRRTPSKCSRARASSKREGRRVVHMEIGEPDFDTPEHIKKAAIEALYDNHTHYTPSPGMPVSARNDRRIRQPLPPHLARV